LFGRRTHLGAIPVARRKRTDTAERLTAGVHVKVTPTERQKLDAAAVRRGISLSDHTRRRLLRRGLDHGVKTAGSIRRNAEAAALFEQVRRLGVNMNQVAHELNATGRLRDHPALEHLCDEIKAVFARIMAL
jgi:hypothetical protein